VGASDLKTRNSANFLNKYADDTYLLIGSSHLQTAIGEYENISTWARMNNLRLNKSKTREMVIMRRGRKGIFVPQVIPEAERVDAIKVLGITLRSDLRMTSHVDSVIAASSSSMYALGVLRSHGLCPPSLHVVAKMTTIAQLMYASPAWWGYATAEDRGRIEQQIARMKRRGLIGPDAPTAAELADSADGRLFAAINANESHVLRGLFPPSRPHLRYELRPRPHGFLLPTKDDRNFISRVLFKNIY
jgi:hypothetical protein